jgi:hypothetical protein
VNTATYYQLYVVGPAGVALNQWYQASSICNDTTCSVVSPTLGGGVHTWYVLTYNSMGVGPWSLATNFSTTIPTAPAAVDLRDSLTNPVDGQDLDTNYNPAFTWKKVDMATYYRLYIIAPAGVALDKWYQTSVICNDTTCSVSDVTLGGGNHTWYVMSYNSAGYGPWSLATNFSTATTAPSAASLLDPAEGQNIGKEYNPIYRWSKVDGATHYRVYVGGPAGLVLDQWYLASNVCDIAGCSTISPALMAGGSYYWYVQTYGPGGLGPWSNSGLPTTFNADTPTMPRAATNLTPTGTTANHTPTYTWDKVSMAVWYHLYIKGPNGPILDQWYQSVNACVGDTCSVVGPALGTGDHTWWVQGWNVAGYGPWKSANFRVSP